MNKRKRSNDDVKPATSHLMGFGYASKIYNDKLMAQKIDNGAFLIPWQSNTDYNHCKFDRYDIRHLLDQIEEFDTKETTNQRDIDWKDTTDKECDQDRYADLDSDEEFLFDMNDAEEREAHVAAKKRRRSKAAMGHMYHYDYDSTSPPATPLSIADRSADIQQIAQQFNIPTTSTMEVPANDDDTSSTIIVETAQAIVRRTQTGNQPTNVCEIQFQVRHNQDRQYDFLNKQHKFYPFYQHVRKHVESTQQPSPSPSPSPALPTSLTKGTVVKTLGALVDYGGDSSDEEEGDDDDDDQNENQATQKIPSDVMETIDKIAASVIKVGRDLEHKIRQYRSQDPKFAFLQPHHPHHSYYQKQLGLQSKQGRL